MALLAQLQAEDELGRHCLTDARQEAAQAHPLAAAFGLDRSARRQ
jgi:hypothetical protein